MITLRTSTSNLMDITQILQTAHADRQDTLDDLQRQYEQAKREVERLQDLRDAAASEITKLNDAIAAADAWTQQDTRTTAGHTEFDDQELDTCIQAVRAFVDNCLAELDAPDAKGSRDKRWLNLLKNTGNAAGLLCLLMEHDTKI